jgi:hypothetical protein
MSEDITFLDLPVLPEDLKNQLISHYQTIFLDPAKVEWMNELHQHSTPIAAQEYGNSNTVMSQNLRDKILSLYQPFFYKKIDIITARTKNLLDAPSCTPPHCDRGRKTAINYVVAAGGDCVTTTFYNETRQDSNLSAAENYRYDQVTVKSSQVLHEQQWHAYNVQRFHSVENIKTERYLLSIFLVNNPSVEEFLHEYKHLIKGDIAQR